MITNKRIDFIGIGAHKAGTSWVYNCLKQLPDFSLPPIKELHYFDRASIYPRAFTHLERTHLYERLKSVKWIKESTTKIGKCVVHGEYAVAKWYSKWYFSNYNDKWYLSLFDSFKGFTGEITHTYAILKKEDILKMYKLVPDAKLIFLLRNPIERTWSHFRFRYLTKLGYDFSSLKIEEIIEFINHEIIDLRSNYTCTIENYSEIFPKNQILLCFYDAINDDPLRYMREVVEFIGGNKENIEKYCQLKLKINVSEQCDIPPKIYCLLKEKYFERMRILANEYGGYCNKWYSDVYGKSECNNDMALSPTIQLK